MLTQISWRNIWRNKTRSFVVIGAIIIGVWAVIFLMSFSTGVMLSYISGAIENEISHVQIHHPEFQKDKESKYYLRDIDQLLDKVQQHPKVKGATSRTVVTGMLMTAHGNRSVQIRGIDPKREAALTKLDEKIVANPDTSTLKEGKKRPESRYFEAEEKKPVILIGKRLAEKLKIKIRHKPNLVFRDIHGNDIHIALRVIGFYQTNKAPFDEMTVFVDQKVINKHFGLDNAAHEVAFLLEDVQYVDTVRTELQAQMIEQTNLDRNSPEAVNALLIQAHQDNHLLDSLLQDSSFALQRDSMVAEIDSALFAEYTPEVQTYREISPDVDLYESQMSVSMTIIIFIVMLALIFGIINTMLMAVLERVRELGMLMAVGMKRKQVFAMIVLETVYLGLIGGPMGLLLGYLTVLYTGTYGIDLSAYSSGMQEFGIAEFVYPSLEVGMYWQVAISVTITAILGALYPAYKAIRLRPVEAIRKI